jgi:hypothetical protein
MSEKFPQKENAYPCSFSDAHKFALKARNLTPHSRDTDIENLARAYLALESDHNLSNKLIEKISKLIRDEGQ